MDGSENEIEIEAPLDAVRAALREPRTYPRWLVGAKTIREVDADWPAIGARFHHTIGAGPLRVPGSTSIEKDEPDLWQLAAGMGPFGEARVRFRLRPAGGSTVVTVEEEPRRGIARLTWKVARPLAHLGLWGRNAASLSALRQVVLERPATSAAPSDGHG